jgi:hypothetical protein
LEVRPPASQCVRSSLKMSEKEKMLKAESCFLLAVHLCCPHFKVFRFLWVGFLFFPPQIHQEKKLFD